MEFTPSPPNGPVQIIKRYKEALSSDPTLYFKDFLSREKGVRYNTMIDWCRRHGISVKALRLEAYGRLNPELPESGKHSSFIQFAPAQVPLMPSALQGVSITFPDGVNLTLQESSVESVIGLLTIYQARQGGAPACSD